MMIYKFLRRMMGLRARPVPNFEVYKSPTTGARISPSTNRINTEALEFVETMNVKNRNITFIDRGSEIKNITALSVREKTNLVND